MVEYFEYELKSPFEFNSNDKKVSCASIKMHGPTNREKDLVAAMTQLVCRAVSSHISKLSSNEVSTAKAASDSISDDEKKPMDGRAMLMILMSSEDDVKVILNIFKELALASGTVMLPDAVSLSTANQYNKLSIEDTYNLLGEYTSNFILSLVM